MTKLVLGGGALALVAWGGAGLGGVVDAVAAGLFVLAAGLAVVALGLALLWVLPLPHSRAILDPSPGGEAEEGPLHVPVLCYRPNGEVDWLLGELLPGSAG